MDPLKSVRDWVWAVCDRMPTPVMWRSWRARRAGAAFDLKFGTDTQSHLAVEALGVESGIARHAVQYEPSALPKVRRVLRRLPVRHEDYCFVDIGAGKGLVSLVASQYPFRRVVGVEASDALCRIARTNLTRYSTQARLRAPVEFLHMNAQDYRFSEDPHVVYLYNPFDEVILQHLISTLLARAECKDIVAYVNPVHRARFDSAPFVRIFDDPAIAIYRRKSA